MSLLLEKGDVGLIIQATTFGGGNLTCAWHDTLADTLKYKTLVKPTATERKGNANKARAKPEMDVWRKHEVEPMYVADSEPAKWR